MSGVFFRLTDGSDKESMLRAAVHSDPSFPRDLRFRVDLTEFGVIRGSPYAYWLSEGIRDVFRKFPRFDASDRTSKLGMKTDDDFRFIRLWCEVAESDRRDWRPLAKGGPFARYFLDLPLLVNWQSDGLELKALSLQRWGSVSKRIYNEAYFGRSGATWSIRTLSGLSVRALPSGCAFSHKGPCAFTGDGSTALLSLIAVMNSRIFSYLVDLQTAASKFEVGVIANVPVPSLELSDRHELGSLARLAWFLRRSLDTRSETSHAFVLPALLEVDGASLAERADGWTARVRAVEAELAGIQNEIDDHCCGLYGIDEADRRAISEGLVGDAAGGVGAEEAASEVDEAEEEQDRDVEADVAGLAAELVSWAVGVAFGRFDVRLAAGEREMPVEPEPFDPLPVCSPGMLVGEDGLPSRRAPSGYPLDFPASGVLVDDPGHASDLIAAVRAVFDGVFGASANALWDEAAALLDPRGHDLRAWLRSGFFEWHLRLHSKSRRKAPILWQLGTPSARYSVWLYAHRLTGDSLFQLQSDVLAPKLAYEERQLASLVQGSGGSPSARERREIEAQEMFVEELRALLGEVRRVTPLWRPTLDDGIVLVMAPLWRLVPHKSWQRELKKKWVELAAGKYDWAQLAMHLWPERVVPNCREDRSLAIAHRLEDVLWSEDEDGRWQPRDEPTRDLDELIQSRTSAAAKDALRGAA